MSNGLVRRGQAALVPMGEELAAMLRICEMVHAAGVLPRGIGNKEQAFAIWLFGKELGIGPWTSWKNIYPTSSESQPGTQLGMSADLMLGLAKSRIPGYAHGHEVEFDAKGEVEAAVFWSERPGVPRLTTRYTLKQAALAGLTTKSNWRKNPELMLVAAAKRTNTRTMAADVLAGVYTPEELGGEDPSPVLTAHLAEPANLVEEGVLDVAELVEVPDDAT